MDDFRDIIDQYRNLVYTLAFYSTGQEEDAEDVTQESFIKLWKHWDQVRGSNVKAWLVQVTRNGCIDLFRKRNRTTTSNTENDYDTAIAITPDNRPDPRENAHSNELRQQIQKALTGIEEPYRSIVILREINDMSYKEISEQLDIPLNTIKVYLHRGRKMLRERLQEGVHV